MGENTKIEWAEHTFNPWLGCTKVSVGDKGACVFCYAEIQTPVRALGVKWGDHPRHRTSESTWKGPLVWNRAAANDNTRPFVFCASLADVFDNQVPIEWLRDLFDLIRATPHLQWLLLTKRPQNIQKLFRKTLEPWAERRTGMNQMELADHWPSNAAILCTVVTQDEANRDIPVLLEAKRVLRPTFAGVSMEPLMEVVDLTRLELKRPYRLNALNGMTTMDVVEAFSPDIDVVHVEPRKRPALDWVITGGESGHHARPSNPVWFRALRDQCATWRVPFLFKQWGEWGPQDAMLREAPARFGARARATMGIHRFENGQTVYHYGKKAADRWLDGRIHDARPVVDRIAA